MITPLLLTGVLLAQSQRNPQQQPEPNQQPPSDLRGTEQSPVVVKVLPTPPTQQETAERNTERDQNTARDRINIRLTTAIAFFTFCSVGVGLLQFGIYRAMHKADVIAQRGWVHLESLWLNFPTDTQHASALIHVKNSGGTPIFIDAAKVKLLVSASLLPEAEYEAESPDTPAILVAKEETRWRHHFAPAEFSVSDLTDIDSGARTLWIYGRIDYRDTHGRRHHYGFARKWDLFKYQGEFASDPAKAIREPWFVHVRHPNYSYADYE